MDSNCTSTNGDPARSTSPDGDLRSTARTEIRRRRERASYERSLANSILDEGLVCHTGFAGPDGVPVVLPLAYARDGDRLLLHGSRASRLLRTLADGAGVCATVTHLDGLVLARSAFHMSMNYRSVVIFGRTAPIEDPEQQRHALHRIVEHIAPGHAAAVRPPSSRELAATTVLALPIDEASVKVRRGPPADDPDDLGSPVWAGQVPLRLATGPPEPDQHALATGLEPPPYLADLGDRTGRC